MVDGKAFHTNIGGHLAERGAVVALPAGDEQSELTFVPVCRAEVPKPDRPAAPSGPHHFTTQPETE